MIWINTTSSTFIPIVANCVLSSLKNLRKLVICDPSSILMVWSLFEKWNFLTRSLTSNIIFKASQPLYGLLIYVTVSKRSFNLTKKTIWTLWTSTLPWSLGLFNKVPNLPKTLRKSLLVYFKKHKCKRVFLMCYETMEY